MKISASWLGRVRTLWVAGFSLFFLLNLDQFGSASGLGPAPKYWSVGFFVATVFLFLHGFKLASFLRRPIVWWAAFYLLMSIVWMGLADNQESAREGLVMVITTVLYVGTAAVAYLMIDGDSRWWKITLWLGLLIAVASIMLEYFVPSIYVFADAGQGIEGRAAGLYLNPNIAGQALLMMLACLMQSGSPKKNIIPTIISFIGLLLTLSRGGLVAWAVLVLAATVMGRLPRWFSIVLGVLAVTIVFAGGVLLDAFSILLPTENLDALNRVAWMLGQGGSNYAWANDRDYLAAYSWQQFLRAPMLGHGLGYTLAWSAGTGTHNLILRHLVEYGVCGLLLLPLFLVFSVRSSAPNSDRYWLWVVAGVALLLGMFSHNMLEQASFVFPWLALCLAKPARLPATLNAYIVRKQRAYATP